MGRGQPRFAWLEPRVALDAMAKEAELWEQQRCWIQETLDRKFREQEKARSLGDKYRYRCKYIYIYIFFLKKKTRKKNELHLKTTRGRLPELLFLFGCAREMSGFAKEKRSLKDVVWAKYSTLRFGFGRTEGKGVPLRFSTHRPVMVGWVEGGFQAPEPYQGCYRSWGQRQKKRMLIHHIEPQNPFTVGVKMKGPLSPCMILELPMFLRFSTVATMDFLLAVLRLLSVEKSNKCLWFKSQKLSGFLLPHRLGDFDSGKLVWPVPWSKSP